MKHKLNLSGTQSGCNGRWAAFIIVGLVFGGCGKNEEDDEASEEEQQQQQILANGNSTTTDSTPAVPQVGAINLDGLGDDESSALHLADDGEVNKCNDGPDMGVFGLALGGACHTSGLASRIMLGSPDGDKNGDGSLDCKDFVEGQDNGIVLGMMCGDFFNRFDGIKSFSFAEPAQNRYMGLSFADFSADDDVTATGSWTKGNAASYPANIRLWGSETSLETLKGMFSANLASLDDGEVQVDFEDSKKGEHIRASSKFKNNLATKSNCATDPSEANCVFQEVKIYNPDDTKAEGAPTGMHIRIMTDDKQSPSFYVLEGRYRYSAEKAAAFVAHGLDGTREIYFRAVQTGGQIWGQFEFRDENDEYVSPAGIPGAILTVLRNGTCKSVSDGSDVTCGAIDPSLYSGLWKTREVMDDMSVSPVTTDFVTGKPTKTELCLAALENCIDLGGK